MPITPVPIPIAIGQVFYLSGMGGAKGPSTFKISMAKLVRIGYMGAISNTVFLLLHPEQALGRRVLERELFSKEDMKRLKELKERIEPAAENEKLEFTLEEYILLYTVIDLSCKVFVSGLSEVMKEINKEVIAKDKASFEEVRDVMLRYNEAIMKIMTERAGHEPAFKKRSALLCEPFWLAGE